MEKSVKCNIAQTKTFNTTITKEDLLLNNITLNQLSKAYKIIGCEHVTPEDMLSPDYHVVENYYTGDSIFLCDECYHSIPNTTYNDDKFYQYMEDRMQDIYLEGEN